MADLNLDELTELAGGRYHLVSLMQKRLRELHVGMQPLIEDTEDLSAAEIVAAELRQKKIWLITGEEADKVRKQRREERTPRLTDGREPRQTTP